MAIITPRALKPEEAEAMQDCLFWLGVKVRWVEDGGWGSDPHVDIANHFRAEAKSPFSESTRDALVEFLRWMDGGDRIHRVDAPPDWEGREFYTGDYGFGDAARLQCAVDMVQFYRDGE